MSVELVALALLMFAVTYPARAVPLLAPQLERLPAPVLAYLRLVGPAVLGAIAAVEVLVRTTPAGPAIAVGDTLLGVVACVAIVAWRRNLALGLIVGVVLVAVLRAAGLA